MDNIFKQIRMERDDFLKNEIEEAPGLTFSQYKTLKKIHYYYSGNFEKGNYENINGVLRKKTFHQLSTWRCDIASKMIDQDLKDFILVSNDINCDWEVFILEKELKAWLKKNRLSKILNEISHDLPIQGSCVLQKTKDGAVLVDLRYLYVDQRADTLENASYINIRRILDHKELRKMKKAGWENVDEAINMFSGKYITGYDVDDINATGSGNTLFYEGATTNVAKPEMIPAVEVWERYGEVPLSWFTNKEKDDNEYVMAKYCVAGVNQVQTNENGIVLAEEGLVLYKEQIDELPFKEVHYNKRKGRWLGVGIVETLFEPQRRINEVANQINIANELSAIQLFQTLDTTIASNIRTDLMPGEILKVKSLIQPIATESRNMVALENTMNKVEEHANDLTFSRDVVSGENAPASATLGAVQIQTMQTTAIFDYKKENLDIFMREFIEDLVYPQIERDLNKEHVLKITGTIDEIKKLRDNFAKNQANARLEEYVMTEHSIEEMMKTGGDLQKVYDMEYQKALDNISLMGDKIWANIKSNFFKYVDYYVDIVSTGENKNIYAQMNNGNALLVALGKDPTLLTDPVKRKVLFKVMVGMGWHLSELEDIEQESLKNEQLTGGTEQTMGGQGQNLQLGNTVQPEQPLPQA